MRLTNFIVQDAILPSLKTTAADVNPRDPEAVSALKGRVIRELVDSLAAAGGFPDGDLEETGFGAAFYADFAPAQAAAIRRAIELMKESRS